jgi:hypothetical protein
MDFSKREYDNKRGDQARELKEIKDHSDDMGERKVSVDQNFAALKKLVRDPEVQKKIEEAHEAAEHEFQDTHREEVEEPARKIQDDMHKDIEEIRKETNDTRRAAYLVDGQGVADKTAAEIKEKLLDDVKGYEDMDRKSSEIISDSVTNTLENQLKILTRHK